MPKVWNKKLDKGIPKDAVYVGRPSKWGNPFKVGRDGTRKQVIKRFEREILPNLDVSELRGKDLVCWCSPKPCHANPIFKKANASPTFLEKDIVTRSQYGIGAKGHFQCPKYGSTFFTVCLARSMMVREQKYETTRPFYKHCVDCKIIAKAVILAGGRKVPGKRVKNRNLHDYKVPVRRAKKFVEDT